jgi:hypothetical protein
MLDHFPPKLGDEVIGHLAAIIPGAVATNEMGVGHVFVLQIVPPE